MENMNTRNDPEYIARVLDQKSQNDPKEIAIREKIENLVMQEAWAKDAFLKIQERQIAYLRDAVAHREDTEYVHDRTQEVLKEIAVLVKSKIVEGGELLEGVPVGSPALIATNHFGAYKLLGIDPKEDVGVDMGEYRAMYPYPMYFAALAPVAERLRDGLYYASNDFPGVFGEIHTAAGFIHVPALAESKTAALIEQTKEAIAKRPHTAIVNYPEGTTSGKPTGGGPYDLNAFKTGAYVIASQLDMPVVPVAQYFDPHEGFKLKVFKPFIPEKTDKAGYEAYAHHDQIAMQQWLDGQRS